MGCDIHCNLEYRRNDKSIWRDIDLYKKNKHFGKEDDVQFGCDVSKGSEELMMELFNKSINESVDNWSTETYTKYMNTRKLKRTLDLVDQKNYNSWINLAIWNSDIFNVVRDVASEDLDKAYEELDNTFCTEENIKVYLEQFRHSVNLGRYSFVTNY